MGYNIFKGLYDILRIALPVLLWIAVAEHPFVEVIGCGSAVESSSATHIAWVVACTTWTIEVPVVSIFNRCGLIHLNLEMRMIVKSLWRQVLQVVGLSVVEFS